MDAGWAAVIVTMLLAVLGVLLRQSGLLGRLAEKVAQLEQRLGNGDGVPVRCKLHESLIGEVKKTADGNTKRIELIEHPWTND